MNDKSYSRITHLVFVLNAIFLVWAILWKCGVPFVGDGSERTINLIPFLGNTRWEMEFNVMLFVPFGFLLSAVATKRLSRQILVVVSTSLLLEIAQYVLAVGRSDITDIPLNSLGGIIGIGAYYLLARLSSRYSCITVMVACVDCCI